MARLKTEADPAQIAGKTAERKKLPAQQRATETYERILVATAQTLCDVGVERLSTNLVCERAGLTPPALYRYFPNKYALLTVLGERLLEKQNERIDYWITAELLTGTPQALEKALADLILDTYEVTEATLGGMWTLKALRAVPALEHVRLDSHRRVATAQAAIMTSAFPEADPQRIAMVARVAVEMIHATIELLFDEPMAPEQVCAMVAAMIVSHLDRLSPQPEASG
ncbi:TetR/AcrR family transcriptional regulator [Pseudomonas syringae]|uniref:TetR family transcriptional regulator n=3 Tax=Pseudomonas syringae group TaxID=136849 RepID=A0A9Q4A055_PSESX|nr:TetR/AcrR family transcriptional regulator [Pseudomonas syringae]KTB57937.1 TetR family transcriptional regulator [Pseudomonas viridiflava ICMP 13104]KTB81582.1 TetR family transcriptional regulator [Pseudomonas syringae pv. syringae PD2766]MCF5466509.1 TetR family transcriptional regulator [Pseudomonas syringae]MCF5471398.1 TetR family transcriptional regulator [Pseudomonas syringae]MCF5482307.1 TetR family transcriptional regulator [Pseudomonas syringae]